MFDFHDYVCLAASGGKECMVNMSIIKKYDVVHSVLKFSKIICNDYYAVLIHNNFQVIYIINIRKRKYKTVIINKENEINIFESIVNNSEKYISSNNKDNVIMDVFFISDCRVIVIVNNGYYVINIESNIIKFNKICYSKESKIIDFVYVYYNKGIFL